MIMGALLAEFDGRCVLWTLELAYAVHVHDGKASAGELEQVWRRTFGG